MNSQELPPTPNTWDILCSDARPAPELLAPGPLRRLDSRPLSLDVYRSPALHRQEVDKVWRRCWQMACREDELAEPGAVVVYDVAELSALVLRDGEGRLRAYANSCPHRGTRLCEANGRQQQLRCPFHGLSWELDGSTRALPCAWDFSPEARAALHLQALPVEAWGGFVFVCFDEQAGPLADYLEVLPEHFRRWPLERRFTAAHAAKVMDCNWKVVIEAFLETFHVLGIHPQALPFLGDVNSQYDVWPGVRHVSRMINPSGVPSPHLEGRCPAQRTVDAAAEFGLCGPGPLQPGETPRGRIVAHLRATIAGQLGVDLETFSDSEVVDVIEYNLFPNLVLFGGFGSPLAYRVRPWGDDPGRCLFEVYMLLPVPEGAAPPPPAPQRWLAADEPFAAVEALSYFGPIIDQDADLMGRVQRGIGASAGGHSALSDYQEIRIRHMRATLDNYLGRS